MSLAAVAPSSAPRLARRKATGKNTKRITALKHQAAMLKANKKFMLLIAGYASGKSHTLHLCVVSDVAAYPGVKILVLAPSYDLLRLNNVPAILEMLDEWGLKYSFNKSEYIVHLSNGSQIILRSMDNPARIVAFEVARSYIDEADVPSLPRMEEAWNKTLGRTRQVIYGPNNKIVSNRVWAFSTPEGFKFCYKRWVKLGGAQYGIVRAKTTDNPFIPSDFVQSLRDTYPSNLIEAYLNGEFVNLTSGAVYYAFDRKICDTDERIVSSQHYKEPLYIGMDFNVNHQAAVVFIERMFAGKKVLVAADEFFDLRDTPDMIDAIKKRYDGHKIIVYPDSSGKNTHTVNSSQSDHSLLRSAGFAIKANPQNPPVKDRIATMNGCLENGTILVNTTMCPEFTEALEQQIYDVNGKPDKSAGVDHVLDAAGYAVHYIQPIVSRKAYLTMVAS
jgi:PBSX family phage terminase large subunit